MKHTVLSQYLSIICELSLLTDASHFVHGGHGIFQTAVFGDLVLGLGHSELSGHVHARHVVQVTAWCSHLAVNQLRKDSSIGQDLEHHKSKRSYDGRF